MKRLDPIVASWARGRKLLELRRFEDASEVIAAAAAKCPSEVTALETLLLSDVLNCLSRVPEARAAYQHYLDHKDRFDQVQRFEEGDAQFYLPYLQNNIAWAALQAGDPADLPFAESLALAAIGSLPAVSPIMGTLGAIRLAQGDVDAGLPLLLEATRGASDTFDKASLCSRLTQGEQARGDATRAENFDRLRQHILAGG